MYILAVIGGALPLVSLTSVSLTLSLAELRQATIDGSAHILQRGLKTAKGQGAPIPVLIILVQTPHAASRPHKRPRAQLTGRLTKYAWFNT